MSQRFLKVFENALGLFFAFLQFLRRVPFGGLICWKACFSLFFSCFGLSSRAVKFVKVGRGMGLFPYSFSMDLRLTRV